MRTVWTATAAGQAALTGYAEGAEIPANIAEHLPSDFVTTTFVSSVPTEPLWAGPYLINGTQIAVLEESNTASAGWKQGYRWRKPGEGARYRWEGVFNWDDHPDAVVVRLVPQRSRVAEAAVPYNTSGRRPGGGGEKSRLVLDKGRGLVGRDYCSYVSVRGEGLWLTAEQTAEVHATLGRLLDEDRGR